jgi:hypothetical protein
VSEQSSLLSSELVVGQDTLCSEVGQLAQFVSDQAARWAWCRRCCVLNLLETRELSRRDIHETREGVCRIGPALARQLALLAPDLRRAVAPHAENLAAALLRDPSTAMPLTRRMHREAVGAS